MKLAEQLNGKRILIWGYGREGRSSFHFIRTYCPDALVDVADGREIAAEEGMHSVVLCPPGEKPEILAYDLVLKTPGIVIEGLTEEEISRLTSQTELFLETYRDQIVGVTGTKGKSTTSSMIAHILSEGGRDAILVGNIGLPCFDFAARIQEETIIVFELSCHQLELLQVSPHVGIILNLYPDHLDHYGTFEKYARAKLNILLHQRPGDLAIIGAQVMGRLTEKDRQDLGLVWYGLSGNHGAEAPEPAGISLWMTENRNASREADDRDVDNLPEAAILTEGRTATICGTFYEIREEDTNLPGLHNVYNIAIAHSVCVEKYGLDQDTFMAGLKTFYGLPHRLQKLGTFRGVDYYDDSISTVCETAIQAVNSVANAETILLGGMDRGIDYRDLVGFLLTSKIRNVILLPGTAGRLGALFADMEAGLAAQGQCTPGRLHLQAAEDMASAVDAAAACTGSGKAVILSPAAASYGFYKNFEERGDVFAACVRSL